MSLNICNKEWGLGLARATSLHLTSHPFSVSLWAIPQPTLNKPSLHVCLSDIHRVTILHSLPLPLTLLFPSIRIYQGPTLNYVLNWVSMFSSTRIKFYETKDLLSCSQAPEIVPEQKRHLLTFADKHKDKWTSRQTEVWSYKRAPIAREPANPPTAMWSSFPWWRSSCCTREQPSEKAKREQSKWKGGGQIF